MSRMAVIVVSALLLASTACTRLTRPMPALCNAMCFAPCTSTTGDTGVRWEAAPEDPAAWDDLGGNVAPALADKLRVCEVRRQSCQQCLQRLDKAGAIKL